MSEFYLTPSGDRVQVIVSYADFVVCINDKGDTLQANLSYLRPLDNAVVQLREEVKTEGEVKTDKAKVVCQINKSITRSLKNVPGFSAGIAARLVGVRPFKDYDDMVSKTAELGLDWEAISSEVEFVFNE
jgi:hypothetical protein